MVPKFAKLGCKMLGLSDKNILALKENSGETLPFPIIADSERTIATTLGMLDPGEKNAEGVPLPTRALIILHNTTVSTILYPATTGRDFEEILRAIASLQLAEQTEQTRHGPPAKSEDAEKKFQEF